MRTPIRALALVLLATAAHAAGGAPSMPALAASELAGLIPRGVTSFGADALGGWLYVFGGYHGTPHAYSREGQSNDFYRIDVRDARVIELLDGGEAMQSCPLAVCDGKLLRVGGMVADNTAGEKSVMHSLASATSFDPRTRAWTVLPDMPQARSSHDIEVIGTRVYAVGGWTIKPGEKGAFCTTIAVLDTARANEGWLEIAAPFKARALAAARLGTKLVIVGGIDSDGTTTNDVRFFDTRAQTWGIGPSFPGEPFGVSATTEGGMVLASGKDGVVWRLLDGDTEWTSVAKLAFPRFFHQLVSTGTGELTCIGGIDDMRPDGRVRHIERVRVSAAAREGARVVEASTPRANERLAERVACLTIPAPITTRNRQGMFVRGNSLTLFGGNRSLRQHDFSPNDFADESWTLDLATLAWRERAKLPEPRQTISALVTGDDTAALAIGGFAHDGEAAVSRSAGFRYDVKADTWTTDERLALPIPRTQIGLVQREGALWIFGGLDYDPRRGDGHAFELPLDVLVLAKDAEHFAPAGVEVSTPRRAFACAELGGNAYLVGGMREEFSPVDECEAFDFATKRFTEIARPRATRVSASLVALGGKLYLAGGSSKGAEGKLRPDRSIEVYEPSTNTWSVLVDELPEPMEHLQAFALRDRLLLVSTHVQGDAALRLCFVNP